LAAYLSASVFTASTALLRATWSRGLPRITPRALAAEKGLTGACGDERTLFLNAANRCSN
jgi:hypothetical protein